MKILVACEYSGVVREAFAAKGHHAVSADLLPSEQEGEHIQGDVLKVLDQDWDMLIAFPPCTYLCSSGMHWTTRGHRDPQLTEDAAKFFLTLWNAPIPKVCIENPVGIMSKRLGKPSQYIQPYQFGHDVSKKTCLWLRGLKGLKHTKYVPPKIVGTKYRWGNQSPCGADKRGPSETRGLERARTYDGIAEAMADQWGATGERSPSATPQNLSTLSC